MKGWVYLVAALRCGAVGALIFPRKPRISPDAASSVTGWTANVIFIVVIGGIGTIEGPIAGTRLIFAPRERLADLGAWYMIPWGTVAVGVMLRAPEGLRGLIVRRFGLHLFPVRRRLLTVEPSTSKTGRS